MTRFGVLSLVLVVLVSLAAVEAQEAKQSPRVGIVLGGPLASRQSQLDAFRQGMRDRGYVEGRNIIFEIRAPENEEDTRFAEFAADLVRLKVDVLVVQATGPILAAKKVTNTTPIVMAPASDPLGTGIVSNLARPGGNITGVSLLTEELSGKRLQLLTEMVPGISRVAILWNPANPANSPELRRVEVTARALNVQLLNLEVRKVEDLEGCSRLRARSRLVGS